MTKRIARSFIDELNARADVVSVVNARVPLKRAGNNMKACCPFHDENTPSFMVSPQKQIYNCFGCGAKGGALNFLMEYEHLDFVAAVEKLAEEVGLEVVYEQIDEKKEKIRKDLYEILDYASQVFQKNLTDNEAQETRAYLRSRGLNRQALTTFALGYSKKDNQLLSEWRGNDYQETREEAKKAGLIGQGDYGEYDQFRNRLMFPIRDYRGRVLGFGARALGDAMPKYLNSPESQVFSKRFILYGLYELLQTSHKIEQIILVEGYMDVIALHQHGVLGAMAALGTALTAEHVKLARKYSQTIYLCFDGDKAGRLAAERAIPSILSGMELNDKIRVVFLPEGEDPDSLVRKIGKAGFNQLLTEGLLFSEFLYQHLIGNSDMSFAEGKGEVFQRAKVLFDELPDSPQKGLLYQGFVEKTGLDVYRSPATMLVNNKVTNSFDKRSKSNPSLPRNQRLNLAQSLVRILLEYPNFAYFSKEIGVVLEKQSKDTILLATVIELIQSMGENVEFSAWLAKPLLLELQRISNKPMVEVDIGKGEDNEARRKRLLGEFVEGYERLINEQLRKVNVTYA